MKLNFKIIIISLFIVIVLLLTINSLKHYPGSLTHYICFTLAFNSLLIMGFREKRIFFDTFIGIFFWLGFWLKLTLGLIFYQGGYGLSSNFSATGPSYDLVLQISTSAALALIIASFLREWLFFSYYKTQTRNTLDQLFNFYKNYRFKLIIAYVLFVTLVAASNIYLGVYQKGSPAKTLLPFGISGVYKWLLLFGLTSFSALILEFEFRIKKNPYLAATLGLFESTLTSVALLSRGMILSVACLGFGAYSIVKKNNYFTSLKFQSYTVILFLILFVSSVLSVNFIRTYRYSNLSVSNVTTKAMVSNTRALFLDRFVGIDGVMAISSYSELGWPVWKKAWEEKYSETGTSFYDINIINSSYATADLSNNHFISLSGIVGFLYYPGSVLFVFFGMFILGLLAATFEFIAFKFTGSLILCSVFGYVLAYRYVHFGYVPAQSYLLLASIVINIFIFFLADFALKRLITKPSVHHP